MNTSRERRDWSAPHYSKTEATKALNREPPGPFFIFQPHRFVVMMPSVHFNDEFLFESSQNQPHRVQSAPACETSLRLRTSSSASTTASVQRRSVLAEAYVPPLFGCEKRSSIWLAPLSLPLPPGEKGLCLQQPAMAQGAFQRRLHPFAVLRTGFISRKSPMAKPKGRRWFWRLRTALTERIIMYGRS